MRISALDSKDHDRIAQAIRAAETRTAGEIYCVVARTSDSYFFPAALSANLAILLAGLAVTLALDHWWYSVPLTHFALAQALAVALALILLWLVPSLRLAFVPLRHRYRRAHDNAVKQFLARNVHITAARTGVLVFVSLAERYAEIIADAGIDARVEQATWNGIVASLIAHARDRRLADGFIEAIGTIGAILAEHFPVGSGDRNELDDHLVEI